MLTNNNQFNIIQHGEYSGFFFSLLLFMILLKDYLPNLTRRTTPMQHWPNITLHNLTMAEEMGHASSHPCFFSNLSRLVALFLYLFHYPCCNTRWNTPFSSAKEMRKTQISHGIKAEIPLSSEWLRIPYSNVHNFMQLIDNGRTIQSCGSLNN